MKPVLAYSHLEYVHGQTNMVNDEKQYLEEYLTVSCCSCWVPQPQPAASKPRFSE